MSSQEVLLAKYSATIMTFVDTFLLLNYRVLIWLMRNTITDDISGRNVLLCVL